MDNDSIMEQMWSDSVDHYMAYLLNCQLNKLYHTVFGNFENLEFLVQNFSNNVNLDEIDVSVFATISNNISLNYFDNPAQILNTTHMLVPSQILNIVFYNVNDVLGTPINIPQELIGNAIREPNPTTLIHYGQPAVQEVIILQEFMGNPINEVNPRAMIHYGQPALDEQLEEEPSPAPEEQPFPESPCDFQVERL